MCGIVGTLGAEPNQVELAIRFLAHRGPDAAGTAAVGEIVLGHTRLAILDLDPRSNQPFCRGQTILTYNGELWNYRELRAELEALGERFSTTGDTEVVAAALDRWGPQALPRFNGMFALGWTRDGSTLHLARDRFGEIPLHFGRRWPFAFASERKALMAMGVPGSAIDDVRPGERLEIMPEGIRRVTWYDLPTAASRESRGDASQKLRQNLEASCAERSIADVPVCTLLSGGIDSAVITHLLAREIPGLVAYTAVMNRKSPDLRAARQIASYLGVRLVEVPIPIPRHKDLATVVRHIEMPHKAQVEIGWACLVLARAIQRDGFKVTFTGEGSDELWASYGFAYHALKTQDWHAYRKTLFLSQGRKNFARCNKVFMSHGIECRLPFLNPALVEHAISLPRQAVQNGPTRPKAVLQEAFLGDLPSFVTQRAKLAFQDGLGLKQAIARNLPDPQRFYVPSMPGSSRDPRGCSSDEWVHQDRQATRSGAARAPVGL
jgi:asparagine synthase (glutamine-hydrolysing)